MKKYYFTFLIVTLLLSELSFAQIPSWQWAWSFGGNRVDQIENIETDSQGNAYVCGFFKSSSVTIGTQNFTATNNAPKSFFAKFSQSGQLIWYKVYPANVQSAQLMAGKNDNFIMLLSFYGTVNIGGYSFTNNTSNPTIPLIVNYNSAGIVISANTLFDSSVTGTYYNQIVPHPGGGFVFLGASFNGTVLNGFPIPPNTNFIGHMDSLGIASEVHFLGGGIVIDTLTGLDFGTINYMQLAVSPKGKIYLGGEVRKYSTSDTSTWILPPLNYTNQIESSLETFVACFDSTFTFQWCHVSDITGDSLHGFVGNFRGMHVFPDESVVMTLNTGDYTNVFFDTLSCGSPISNLIDGIATKITGTGIVQWVKSYDSFDNSENYIFNVSGDAMGNIFMAMNFGSYANTDGSLYSNFVVLKLDANGNTLWSRGSDNGSNGGIYTYIPAMKEDGRGNVFIVGGFSCQFSPLPDFGGTILPWATPVFTEPDAFNGFIAKLNNCTSLPISVLQGNTHSICNGDSIQLTAIGGPSFIWSDLDSSASRWISQADTLTLLSYDTLGCYSLFDTVRITTRPIYNNAENINLCFGDSITINNQSYLQTGVYQNIFTAINGCDSTVTTSLYVDTLQAQIQDVGLALQTSNTANGNTFQWLDCNNNFSPLVGETNQSFTPITNGSYAVLIDNSTCQDTSACYDFVTVNTLNLSDENSFIIAPNPIFDVLRITTVSKTIIAQIRIIDLVGNELYIGPIDGNGINLSHIESGCYTIEIFCNKSYYFKQIIKL